MSLFKFNFRKKDKPAEASADTPQMVEMTEADATAAQARLDELESSHSASAKLFGKTGTEDGFNLSDEITAIQTASIDKDAKITALEAKVSTLETKVTELSAEEAAPKTPISGTKPDNIGDDEVDDFAAKTAQFAHNRSRDELFN